jgi:DNA-binding beta-propeller fold protein YncE
MARAPLGLAMLAALLIPATASATPPDNHASTGPGALTQLPGSRGCLVDSSSSNGSCGTARALDGPGPFMGSRAIALSPRGENVYVASSKSDAIAIFTRSRRTGALSQAKGAGGCIAAEGADGCASAIGLDGPNSVAVSPDGKNVYATSRTTGSITSFHRNHDTGALTQTPGGCIADVPLLGCTAGRALGGADVVVVSPDGQNAYVGSFFANSVAVFDRDSSTGALTQPADATGCVAEATSGCTAAVALASPEGMAISADGDSVYVGSAVSNALVTLTRDPATGALTQATDGTGCIVDAALTGCITGAQLSGANAVATAPGGDVYVTSLLSNSVTTFSGSPAISQLPGTTGCLVFEVAVGCSLGHALSAPEGVAVSPDGSSVYAAAFSSGAIAVLDRAADSGAVTQKSGDGGCVARRALSGCGPARKMRGTSSMALSPDGRYLYSTAFDSDSVGVFKRRGSHG